MAGGPERGAAVPHTALSYDKRSDSDQRTKRTAGFMHSIPVALPTELTEFLSAADEATRDYGRRLAKELPRPCLVLLSGELGAGKTTLVKGLAEGMGVAREEDVASPSYTLIHEYHGDTVSLYHIDLYRLDTTEQVGTLGLEDLLGFELDPQAVVVIEWGAKFSSFWAQNYLEIRLDVAGDEQRRITARWTAVPDIATTALAKASKRA